MIDLFECLVEQIKFGKSDEGEFNIDLIIFTHPSYIVQPNNMFVVFEINYN